MNAALAIGGWTALAFIVALAVYGGFRLLVELERFVATKFAKDAGCDWTDPDGGLAATADLEVLSHNGTSTTRCQHDHGARG